MWVLTEVAIFLQPESAALKTVHDVGWRYQSYVDKQLRPEQFIPGPILHRSPFHAPQAQTLALRVIRSEKGLLEGMEIPLR